VWPGLGDEEMQKIPQVFNSFLEKINKGGKNEK
jgi:hypothetical protein